MLPDPVQQVEIPVQWLVGHTSGRPAGFPHELTIRPPLQLESSPQVIPGTMRHWPFGIGKASLTSERSAPHRVGGAWGCEAPGG